MASWQTGMLIFATFMAAGFLYDIRRELRQIRAALHRQEVNARGTPWPAIPRD